MTAETAEALGPARAGPRTLPPSRTRAFALLSLLSTLSFFPSPTHGTITVPAAGAPDPASPSSSSGRRHPRSRPHSFPSQPALFGAPIPPGVEFEAHLQRVDGDAYLCGSGGGDPSGLRRSSTDDADRGGGGGGGGDEGGEEDAIVAPRDGRPVVLLAKRGGCSFETKARVAQYLSRRMSPPSPEEDLVRYVLVYDDVARTGLVPMSATDGSGIDVSLLFVSLDTGIALNKVISEQTSSATASGGTLINLDSDGPFLPSDYDDPREYMLAAMAGFFLVLACFGCLIMCAQSGYVHTDGNVIYLGRRPPGEEAAGDGAPLLTEEQVLSLPEVEFRRTAAPGDDGGTTSEVTAGGGPGESARGGRRRRGGGSGGEGGGGRSTESLDPAESLLSIPHSLLERSMSNSCNAACSICLEEYDVGEKVRVLPCQHIFHTECIVPWLTERAPCCPLCKADVVADSESEAVGEERSLGPASETSDIEQGEQEGTRWGSLRFFFNTSNRPEGRSWLSGWLSGQGLRTRNDQQQAGEVVGGLRTPLLQDQRSPPMSRRPSGSSVDAVDINDDRSNNAELRVGD